MYTYLQASVPVYTVGKFWFWPMLTHKFPYVVVLGPYFDCWGSLLGPYCTKKWVLIGSLSQSLGVFISFRDSANLIPVTPPIPLSLLSVTHVIPRHCCQPRHHCHPCRLRHPIHPPHLNNILLSRVKNRFALFTHVVFHSFSCIILSNILALDPCFLAGC